MTRSIIELMQAYIERRQNEGALRKYPPQAILGLVGGAAQHYGMMTGMFGYPAEVDDELVSETFTRIILSGIQTADRT